MSKQWKRSLSGDDVQAEAEDALEKDISQMAPASNSVAGQLDGGVSGGTDWSNKSFETSLSASSHFNTTHLDIAGSGYLAHLNGETGTEATFAVEIDSNGPYEIREPSGSLFPIRFSNSCKITSDSVISESKNAWVVLD